MEPIASIIIPVGPGHAAYVAGAVASCRAQSQLGSEVLVVNDSGGPLPDCAPDRALETGGRAGVAAARNLGTAHARAPWVVYLDADDLLMPRALEHLLAGAAELDACYIYGGWYNLWRDGGASYAPPPRYRREALLTGSLHPVTALYPTDEVRALGGFDPTWRGYEDWEFQLRLAAAGICGAPVHAATLIYRAASGWRREFSRTIHAELRQRRDARYGAYVRGEERLMACSGCGGGRARALAESIAGGRAIPAEPAPGDTTRVRMEHIAAEGGSWSFRNPFGGSGETYRISPGSGRYISAHPADVAWLSERGFRVLARAVDPLPEGIAPLLADDPPPPILPQVAPHDPDADPDADVADSVTAAEPIAAPRRRRGTP